MRSTCSALCIATCMVMLTSPASAQSHPMDALTADEIRAAAIVLKADPRTKEVAFRKDACLLVNFGTLDRMVRTAQLRRIVGPVPKDGDARSLLPALNGEMSERGLPWVSLEDSSYLNESGCLRQSVPEGKAILLGSRTNGSKIAEYRVTRNANLPGRRLPPGSSNA